MAQRRDGTKQRTTALAPTPSRLHALPPSCVLRWFLLAAALALAGCQTVLPTLPSDLPERVELDEVPFFPQAEFQCGPAALATVLRRSGIDAMPDALAPMVYLPGRKGSLQTELIAATRQFDRIPYPLPADVRSVLREVAAGRPVLVLQNLGLQHWPQWHFAVVVGFDRTHEEVMLRSGTERRATLSLRRFVRTWERGNRWAVVVLQPRELPVEAEPERYLTAAAGLEAVGRLQAAHNAYETARAAWPDSTWPLLGLANVAYLRNQYDAAATLYRQLIARDPSHLSARYNFAETLVHLGCPRAARAELQSALALAADTALRGRLQGRLDELQGAGGREACTCSTDAC